MTLRFFAVLTCVAGARDRPRLWYVAAALILEALVGHEALDIVHTSPFLVNLVWFASPALLVATALASFRLRRVIVGATAVATTAIVWTYVCQGRALLFVMIASCAAAMHMIARTKPGEADRFATVVALVGNVAASTLAMLVGTDEQSARAVVGTANDLTHLAVSGICLWAMRR